MASYIVYGQKKCVYCIKAVELLDKLNIKYDYYDIGSLNFERTAWLRNEMRILRWKTAPMIYMTKEPNSVPDFIGGFHQLEEMVFDRA